MKIWRMRITCSIPKTTYTQSECVIFIDFILQQQWLQERASMLRLYLHGLSCLKLNQCSCSPSQEIPFSVANPNIHYALHSSPTLVPFLSHTKTSPHCPSYFGMISSNTVLPGISILSTCSYDLTLLNGTISECTSG